RARSQRPLAGPSRSLIARAWAPAFARLRFAARRPTTSASLRAEQHNSGCVILPAMLRPIVLALTVCTGFTGLAYEITWQKYLQILLGAHSEATATVLGLFLGGLSLGYWSFGHAPRAVGLRGRRHGGRPGP